MSCQECPRKSDSQPLMYDILIIGGGAIGCSIARELSRYKANVILLEKSSDVSQGASKANSGIIHGGYDDEHGTVKAKMSFAGNQLFPQLNRELKFGFRKTGSLVLAFSPADLDILHNLMINGQKNGMHNLEIWNKEDVIKKEPHINKNVLAALYCPHAGIASPYEYVIALAENAVQNNATIKLDHEVSDILIVSNDTVDVSNASDTHFLVKTNPFGDTFRSKIVVNAAGLMADRVASMVGADNFYIKPRKGEYIILDKSQGHLARHVLFPVPNAVKGKGVLVSPTFHGNLLLGPTSRGVGEGRLSQREVLRQILSSSRHLITDFDPTKAITSYTGSRAKCSRNDFIIEENESVSGFINVAGIDSPGLTSSPAVAKEVVRIVKSCLQHLYNQELLLNPHFNPFRNAIIVKKGPEFKGKIGASDPSLNIICRCERVTESEIVDSICRPIGARDTDAVKRRTRAGMGQCQGSYCEPKVAAIISKVTGSPLSNIKGHSSGSSILPHRRVTDEDRQLLAELALASKL